MQIVETELLNIAFEMAGPAEGQPVLLLHGWPDSPACWSRVSEKLQQAGFKTIAPWLRGSSPTEFRSQTTPRFAGPVAMAQDVIELANRLGIERFSVVGHDWGARIAYTLAALFPDRVPTIAALALAYRPRGEFQLGSFTQARQFWYQFLQCTEVGAEAVRHDPVGFARIQWNTWSPEGWFDEADFTTASMHFDKPDWAEITLNAYRSRYLPQECFDARYEELQSRLKQTSIIRVPTLAVHGSSDFCDLPASFDKQEQYFSNGYRRLLLDGVGHFPHREASAAVSQAVLEMLNR